ncbi:MAG TPA: HlyD family type I secretion periplasmic adaptor subunit [Hyphomicrobium sp.]|nr:HlyD family type I secretion periplasmic adaptor subunit [Hyphomicrobium sp.]
MTTTPIKLDAWQQHVPDGIRWPTVLGLAILGAWVFGFGAWAALAPLDGAVVASGSFVANGQNKQVQHLEGGIIRDMLVREGDLVEAGQSLVRLDDVSARAKLRRLVLREYRLLTMQARLEAQVNGAEDFALPATLTGADADVAEVTHIFQRQKMELQARRQNQTDEEEVLRKEVAALRESINGYRAQAESVEQRLKLFSEELSDKKELLDRQLARKTEVMALRRAEADLVGSRGELLGRIADSHERIARAEQQIAELRSSAIQKTVEELRQTETELDDVREQIGASRDVLQRVDIKAPERGVVVRVNYHTRGAVVAPGAVILELLPVDDKLVIEGRINPNDISHVHNGQAALIRLTALNQRLTPVIEGSVVYVSADAIADQKDQERDGLVPFRHQSYIVRVKLNEGDVHRKIGEFQPTPGMPADVYIKTGERTFFEYMLRPVLDSFSRAFREH